MSAIPLDTPFTDGGLPATNFFNGRILSREDLQREQAHAQAIAGRLGMAIGGGVVNGFEVTATALGSNSLDDPQVTVKAGLAVNALGDTLCLAADVDVKLKRPTAPQDAGTVVAGSFGDCEPAVEGTYVVGTGVYLLTVAPAQVRKGLALVSGLGNEAASCNVKEVIEGVQFRLYEVSALSQAELGAAETLRNVAAYKFFLAELAAADPIGRLMELTPPAAQSLTGSPVDSSEVPLAILNWTDADGLVWVDAWAVRRMARPGPQTGLSMIRQFQAQLLDGGASLDSGSKAINHFRWLPPLGAIPIQGAVGALDPAIFFTGIKRRSLPAFIESARLPLLAEEAARFPPIDPQSQEAVWTYFVHQNIAQAGSGGPEPVLVFTNGQVPYAANARFDLGYWGYANYALP